MNIFEQVRWLRRVNRLGPFESKIIDLQIDRLLTGQKTYGEWEPNGGRDLSIEAYEELLDAVQYLAARLLELKEKSNV